MIKMLRLKRGNGSAPHKPVLLLAVISLMDEGLLPQNRISITPELIAAFQKIWLELVPDDKWQPRFFLPFFHLANDGFWHLELVRGTKVALTSSYSPKSLSALRNSVRYAWLDQDLFENLQSEEPRKEARQLILKHFFSLHRWDRNAIAKGSSAYMQQLEDEFLGSSAAEIKSKYQKLLKTEARSILFKSIVPKMYKYRCAISGQWINASNAVQMVDACHIKPWSSYHDDSITNGIALTPTLHRAFDNHLLSIDAEYRVVFSSAFKEDLNSSYAISQFEGRKILLPQDKRWYPSQEALEWHRSNLLEA